MKRKFSAKEIIDLLALTDHTYQRLNGLLTHVYAPAYGIDDVELIKERFKHTHSRDTTTELESYMQGLNMQVDPPETPQQAVTMIHLTALVELYSQHLRRAFKEEYGLTAPMRRPECPEVN